MHLSTTHNLILPRNVNKSPVQPKSELHTISFPITTQHLKLSAHRKKSGGRTFNCQTLCILVPDAHSSSRLLSLGQLLFLHPVPDHLLNARQDKSFRRISASYDTQKHSPVICEQIKAPPRSQLHGLTDTGHRSRVLSLLFSETLRE